MYKLKVLTSLPSFLRWLWLKRAAVLYLYEHRQWTGLMQMGSVSEPEGSFLEQLTRESSGHPGDVVEIGTLLGFGTHYLAAGKAPAQRLISVDNYSWNPLALSPEQHVRLTRAVLHALIARGEVELRNEDKDLFFQSYAPVHPPALVFLDSDHSYEGTREDIRRSRQLGAKLICGHDYQEACPGVVRAVDEAGGPNRLVGSVWVL
jgi:hypothetical protein